MNTVNQAQLADPVQVLPKENLLQIFSYLSQDDIDASSKVNHNWRYSIQSDFSLFTCIEVKNADPFYSPGANPSPWWEEEESKLEGMRMTIGTLSRLASLSNNRLNEVSIGLAAFERSIPESAGGWRFSKLSLVFDVLTLSSPTLTKLQLDFPETTDTEVTIKASGKYIQTVLDKLSTFPHLREVELRVLPSNLKIISKSINKTLKLLSHSFQCGGTYAYSHFGQGSFFLPLSRVISDANFFTGGQTSHLASAWENHWPHQIPVLEIEAMQSIQGSAETLEELDVEVCWTLPIELPNLVVRCPQLTSFKLYCSLDYQNIGNEDWRVDLPVESVQESKLKTLAICIAGGPGQIIINESMLKWVGSSLEILLLKTDSEYSSFEEARQLHSLIQNVSLTLSSLEIEGFYDSTTLLQSFSGSGTTLYNLRKLSLVGNHGFINGFLSAFDFVHVTHLELGGSQVDDERAEVDAIYKVVRQNSSSLEILHLSESILVRSLTEAETSDRIWEPMDLPNLIKLSLSVPFESETGPFSKSKLPKLKKLELFGTLQPLRHLFSSGLSQLDVE